MLFVSPSVRLSIRLSPHFGNISQTARMISIIFCVHLLFRMRRNDTNVCFGPQTVKGFFRGGPKSQNCNCFYNRSSKKMQNNVSYCRSIGLKSKYLKGAPFYFAGEGRGGERSIKSNYFYLVYYFSKIWNIVS